MLNFKLKEEALKIYKEHEDRYNASQKQMKDSSERLYNVRLEAIDNILMVENVVNSIANTPKEFEIELGKINEIVSNFKKTEEFAKESYENAVRAGVGIAEGAALGLSIATMAPSAFMGIATTFGTAATGTAISTLSGVAAKKAAFAWIGRTFAGFMVKQGAGMAAGQAFLALAGPIGWTINGGTIALSLFSLNKKNAELADQVMNEAKEISKMRESIDEIKDILDDITLKTSTINEDILDDKDKLKGLKDSDYNKLNEDNRNFLGSIVNNILSLSTLIAKTIE